MHVCTSYTQGCIIDKNEKIFFLVIMITLITYKGENRKKNRFILYERLKKDYDTALKTSNIVMLIHIYETQVRFKLQKK
jgi:hypothetical protein